MNKAPLKGAGTGAESSDRFTQLRHSATQVGHTGARGTRTVTEKPILRMAQGGSAEAAKVRREGEACQPAGA